MMNRRRNRAGMTLLEVLIASIILAAVIGATMLLLTDSSRSYQDQNLLLNLDQRGREIVNEMTRELRMSNLNTLTNGATNVLITPNDTVEYTNLKFKVPGTVFDMKGYQAAAANILTQTIQYRWALSTAEGAAINGVDDDKNGVVDDGVVQRIENGVTRKLCPDLKVNGLRFKVPLTNPGRVEITLDMEVMDGRRKAKISRTVQTAVELRN